MTAAVILAAGQGTRLRPLTNDRPKGMVPLGGVSLLERQIAALRRCALEDITIACGYRADIIELLDVATIRNPHYAHTNMVETLFCCRSVIERCAEQAEDLIVSYGDIVYQVENLKIVLDSPAPVSVMIDLEWKRLWAQRQEDPLEDAETLVMDAAGRILELGKKPQDYSRIHGQYTGLIKFSHTSCEGLLQFYDGLDQGATYDGKDFPNMYMTSFIQGLIDSGWDVRAATVKGGWLEVDSTEDLALYEKLLASGELAQLCELDHLETL